MPTVATFVVAPNPDADALFAVRDICANPVVGYELEYPEVWWTNTAVGSVPACSWFSPTFYEVPDPNQRPPEIAIALFRIGGHRAYIVEIFNREDGSVDGQPARRVESGGTRLQPPDFRAYEYAIQLGTPESGPELIGYTDTTMGGNYALNKAVLDRIMATLVFVGSTQ